MVKSAYVHIPFCKRKCNYCSFVSFEDISVQDLYIENLVCEINHFYRGEILDTLYFGGGTPSLLSVENLKKITNAFNFNENTEVTIEANPDSASSDFLKAATDCGINRLSLGVQSFDDKILKSIGRLHNSAQAFKTYDEARKSGFENISLDFIYGLPNQSLKNYENTLKKAVELAPEHISLYGLKIEEGSKFAKKKPANLADEDLQAEMFLLSIEKLKGYLHYEFSNYSKKETKDFSSKHNLNYWNNEEYYGFGVSAHGYVDGVRYSNFNTLSQYLQNPFQQEDSVILTNEEKLQEEIFLGFRKCEGIDVEKINRKYSINFSKVYKKVLDKYLESKHLLKTEKGYKLSSDGILLSNNILCDFL